MTERYWPTSQGKPIYLADDEPLVITGFSHGEIMYPNRDELLAQAKADVLAAMVAIEGGNWLKADGFLKLAIDQIADAGLLP